MSDELKTLTSDGITFMNLKYHWLMNVWRRCDRYIDRHYLTLKKRRKFAICDNTDEPGRYYTKWDKPDTGRQTLYDLT
jgi:hypothetical protein